MSGFNPTFWVVVVSVLVVFTALIKYNNDLSNNRSQSAQLHSCWVTSFLQSAWAFLTYGVCGKSFIWKIGIVIVRKSAKYIKRSFEISTLLEERPTGSLWYSPLVLSRCRLRAPGLNVCRNSIWLNACWKMIFHMNWRNSQCRISSYSGGQGSNQLPT